MKFADRQTQKAATKGLNSCKVTCGLHRFVTRFLLLFFSRAWLCRHFDGLSCSPCRIRYSWGCELLNVLFSSLLRFCSFAGLFFFRICQRHTTPAAFAQFSASSFCRSSHRGTRLSSGGQHFFFERYVYIKICLYVFLSFFFLLFLYIYYYFCHAQGGSVFSHVPESIQICCDISSEHRFFILPTQ